MMTSEFWALSERCHQNCWHLTGNNKAWICWWIDISLHEASKWERNRKLMYLSDPSCFRNPLLPFHVSCSMWMWIWGPKPWSNNFASIFSGIVRSGFWFPKILASIQYKSRVPFFHRRSANHRWLIVQWDLIQWACHQVNLEVSHRIARKLSRESTWILRSLSAKKIFGN
jgi:hypothetical protein